MKNECLINKTSTHLYLQFSQFVREFMEQIQNKIEINPDFPFNLEIKTFDQIRKHKTKSREKQVKS